MTQSTHTQSMDETDEFFQQLSILKEALLH